jgi:hypothetical protein
MPKASDFLIIDVPWDCKDSGDWKDNENALVCACHLKEEISSLFPDCDDIAPPRGQESRGKVR